MLEEDKNLMQNFVILQNTQIANVVDSKWHTDSKYLAITLLCCNFLFSSPEVTLFYDLGANPVNARCATCCCLLLYIVCFSSSLGRVSVGESSTISTSGRVPQYQQVHNIMAREAVISILILWPPAAGHNIYSPWGHNINGPIFG